MIPIKTKNYVRIDKRTARKLYATGAADLYFCPVNLNPESPWGLLYGPVNREWDFDRHVMIYESHNCHGSETGRYAAFYVPRAWWEAVEEARTVFIVSDELMERIQRTAHAGTGCTE